MTAKISLTEKFFEQAALNQEATAFYYCRPEDNRWVTMSWNRYREEVATLAAWFQAKGMTKGAKVGLISSNRPEWLISDLAILSIGGITIPIYPSASQNDISFILQHSEAKWLVVDTLDRLPYLKDKELKGLLVFNKSDENDALAKHFKSPVSLYASAIAEGNPAIKAPMNMDDDDLATIIYTSGTTGFPKGVMHTHRNLSEAMVSSSQIIESPEGTVDRFFSFLPLSHVAERVLVEMGAINIGAEVSFARSVETIVEDLPRCQPTILLCVPRLWEKMQEGIMGKLNAAGPAKKMIFKLANAMGSSRIEGNKIHAGAHAGIFPAVADALVGKKLRERLGLNRTRLFVTGSAPTRPELQKFFAAFGMPIREVYGLTENLCCGVLQNEEDIFVDNCGKPFPGNEMRIAEDGEIQFRAPWMFTGYYKNEEATREVLSADGWFSTGDLGKIDTNGRLYITGRKKEMLKTSNGKYVAPVPIEDRVKGLPLIKEVMMVGDERKYCVALIALEHPHLEERQREEIKSWIKKVNEPLAGYEAIKRIGVLKEGFTIENGSLTPTMKLKRSVVAKNKEAFIDRLYKSDDFLVMEA